MEADLQLSKSCRRRSGRLGDSRRVGRNGVEVFEHDDDHRVSDPRLRGLEGFGRRTGGEMGGGLIEQAASCHS